MKKKTTITDIIRWQRSQSIIKFHYCSFARWKYRSLLCLNVYEDIHLVFFEEVKVVIATVGWLLAEGIFSLSLFYSIRSFAHLTDCYCYCYYLFMMGACRRAREHVCSLVKTISTSTYMHTYILKSNACVSSVRCTVWTDERTNEWNGRERVK
jgi:hypothetical protein